MSESSGGLYGQQSQGGGWSLHIRSSSLSPIGCWGYKPMFQKAEPSGEACVQTLARHALPWARSPLQTSVSSSVQWGSCVGCSERVLVRSGCSCLGIHLCFPAPTSINESLRIFEGIKTSLLLGTCLLEETQICGVPSEQTSIKKYGVSHVWKTLWGLSSPGSRA